MTNHSEKPKINIICITTLFPSSINERHGIFIANRLMRLIDSHDIEIHVIAPVPLRSRKAFQKEISSKIDRHFTSVSRPRFISIPILNRYISPFSIAISAFFTAIKIRKSSKIKVIDSHFLYPDSVSAYIVSKTLGIPLINTARGSDVNYWGYKKIPRFFIKKTIEAAKVNFAVSNKLAEKMKLIAPDANIHPLPNGVDHSIFFPPLKKSTVKNYKFLSVGNLIPLKGHNLVIEAIAKIPNATLEIIGQGDERKKLIQQVKSLGLEEKIEFSDNIPQVELAKKYQTAHALILASEMEGMPNVVLEAMSCGLQVICTPVGDLPNILSEDLGWIVDRNAADIKKAALDSILHPKNYRVIAEFSNQNFSWENTIKKYFHSIVNI